jgi:hypothetical protein
MDNAYQLSASIKAKQVEASASRLTSHRPKLAWAALGLALVTQHAQAGAAPQPEVQVRIAPLATMAPGAHAQVVVTVEFAAPNAEPLLLTPSSQGVAVEVVRGRLSRSDAKSPSTTQLHFDVPVIARAEGTAIVHLELHAYVCHARCRRIVAVADQPVRVARR